MDCLALHENSPNGEYWANATNFLYCFQVFGYPFHKELAATSFSNNAVSSKLMPKLSYELFSALKKVC